MSWGKKDCDVEGIGIGWGGNLHVSDDPAMQCKGRQALEGQREIKSVDRTDRFETMV